MASSGGRGRRPGPRRSGERGQVHDRERRRDRGGRPGLHLRPVRRSERRPSSDPDRPGRGRLAPDPGRVPRRRTAFRTSRGRRGAARARVPITGRDRAAGSRRTRRWRGRDRGRERRNGHRDEPRRGLPPAARPLRRGRHRAGTSRARRGPLRRGGRPRLRHGHGQGDDEARVPGRGTSGHGVHGRAPLGLAARPRPCPGGRRRRGSAIRCSSSPPTSGRASA